MKQTRSISLSKTRLLRRGNLQTWVKAEITTDFIDQEPTFEDITEIISDIDIILLSEEETEHDRWNQAKDQPR